MEKLEEAGVERNDMVRKINQLVDKSNSVDTSNAINAISKDMADSIKAMNERLALTEREVAKNLLTFHLSAPNVNKEAILKAFKELSPAEFIKQHGIKIK